MTMQTEILPPQKKRTLFAKCDHTHGVCDHRWYFQEEKLNSLLHTIGAVLSMIALVVLWMKADKHGARTVVGCVVFGFSLVITYVVSGIYHGLTDLNMKHYWRRFDHISIYLLIAGTYTPFTLVILKGVWGWSLFGVVWGLALAGILFKIFLMNDRYSWISTLTYVCMGWLALVAVVPILQQVPVSCLLWLLSGGILYTLGVFFFLLETVPFAHSIWHVFVMAGSFCHFFAVYQYVADSLT